MEGLHKDIAHLVLSFLHLDDLVNCRVVSKLFSQIIDNNFVKFKLAITPELHKKEKKKNKFEIESAINICEGLPLETRKKVSFVTMYSHSVDFEKERKLIQMLPNLRRLEVYRYSMFLRSDQQRKTLDEFTDDFVRQLPSSISHLELNDIKLKARDSLPVSLDYLSISSGTFQFDNLARLSSLRKLCLSSGIENSNIFHYLPTSLHSLLIWFQNDVTSLEGLQNLRKLKTLDLTALNIRDKDFAFLPHSIHKLTLQELKLTTRQCFTMLPPNLTFLEINGANYNADEAAPYLPTSLKKLVISNCRITLSTFNFPSNLSILGFNDINVLGDLTFEKLPKKLNNVYVTHFVFDPLLVATFPETVTSVFLLQREFTFWTQLHEVIQKLKELKRFVTIKVKHFEDTWVENEWKTWN